MNFDLNGDRYGWTPFTGPDLGDQLVHLGRVTGERLYAEVGATYALSALLSVQYGLFLAMLCPLLGLALQRRPVRDLGKGVVAGAVVWAFGTTSMKLFRFSTPVTVLTAWQHVAGVIPLALGAAILAGQHPGIIRLPPARMRWVRRAALKSHPSRYSTRYLFRGRQLSNQTKCSLLQ